MGSVTGIEWTDATWNAVRGCTKVSEGCQFCYAMQVAYRFSGPGQPYEGLAMKVGGQAQWTNQITLAPERLHDPLKWRKPRRIFVNSMSDLFHGLIPDEYIDQMFAVMALCPQHTFQVLTKRPQRMQAYLTAPHRVRCWREAAKLLPVGESNAERASAVAMNRCADRVFPNIQLLVSVEDQSSANIRIPFLMRTPAALRGVSYEPALGPVDFSPWLPIETIGGVELEKWLDWIIIGGESGPHARPFDLAWARQTVQQCKNAGVPVFVKQMGSKPHTWAQGEHWPLMFKDKKGSDINEFPCGLRVRQFPEVSA